MLQTDRWKRPGKTLVMVLCGYLGASAAVLAGEPVPGMPAHLPRPTNLKVLPKNISEAQLGRTMKEFRDDLGVTCSYCHVENPDTRKLDYASDENPRKATARLMITMTNDINQKYLAQLGGGGRYAATVTCGSCHQGESNPPVYEAP